MKKLLILALVLGSIQQSFAIENLDLASKVFEMAGTKLQKLNKPELSKNEVVGILGKPHRLANKESVQKLYYKIDGYKYKAIFSIRNNKVVSIQYKNLDKNQKLSNFSNFIKTKDLHLSKSKRTPSSNGRYLVYENSSVKIWFKNNKNKTVARWEVLR